MNKFLKLNLLNPEEDLKELAKFCSRNAMEKIKTDILERKQEYVFYDDSNEIHISRIINSTTEYGVFIQHRQSSEHDEKMKFLGEISTNLFHELNSPLNIMISSLELLKMELFEDFDSELAELANKRIEIFEIGVLKIFGIIKGLKNYANGKSESKIVDLEKFSKETIEFSNMFLKDRHINLTFNCQISKGSKLAIQDALVSQVLINLIKNAADVIKDFPKFNRWIEVNLTETADEFIYEVKDSGKGISPENQAKLFTYGFTTKAVGEGNGIGLNFCKKIMNEHAGSIDYNPKSSNTCFILKFPKKTLKSLAA